MHMGVNVPVALEGVNVRNLTDKNAFITYQSLVSFYFSL